MSIDLIKIIPERIKQNLLESPNQVILRLLFNNKPEQAFTYRDFFDGSYGYAHALKNAGILPGEVVILILEHGEDLIFAFFGAMLHGAVPSIMPFLTEKLSPEQYRRALSALFEITAPAAVVTYPEFEHEVLAAIQPGSSVRIVLLNVDIHPVNDIDLMSLQGFHREPEDIVLLQHSSGTTGLQKGVALSHQAIFNQLESYSEALKLDAEDVIVSWLPLYHDMGLIAGLILPIMNRIPLVLLSPFDWVRAPYRLLQAISTYQGTLTWLPNFAYNFCTQKIRDRDLEGVSLASLRAVINCSEPMYFRSHMAFLDRFRNYGFRAEALATCYAMAENVFAVTQGGISTPVTVDEISQVGLLSERVARLPTDGELSIKMLSAGPPIRNTKIRVLDEHHHELPDRHLGEIALLSDCMLTGYYNRPDATVKAFHKGWYLTGDLGYIANGEVYVTGRKKDLIIVGGKNIYPQDLENLANEVHGVHPGRVVAFGVPNEDTGTEDVVILAEMDFDPTSESSDQMADRIRQIEDEIRQRVNKGSDIALRFVKLLERGWLLKTSSGKIARSANREKYLNLFSS